ncbi:MAG: methionyl-tRNA formyltransferase [Oscillospiraceae bacterium]|nr:methionyl-tRNA formyltransferase [Oscillospiraceae bacterium]
MRIVFMGTPDFAVKSLDSLQDSPHEVAAVFTRADKPRNRGKKVAFSPVKEAALKYDIPVYQPTSLKTDESVHIIKEINPDCIVVAAYGVILPESVLNIPKHGCINVHASLLPKYRGAAPINRCIMDGETKSGVTIMQMDKGLDTGDMLLSEEVAIHDSMTATELHDILAQVGGRLIVHTLDNIGNLTPTKQDDKQATYASMLTKTECELDCSHSAKALYNRIRGLADSPCAYTFIGDKRVKVFKAALNADAESGIAIKCGDGETLFLTEIRPEGGKRMSAAEFLRGLRERK